jgi:hypothetical protein
MGMGLEVVTRSGRDEPMWVVTHMCMEATLGISLYSYLYLKQAKTLCLSYLLRFLFIKIGEPGVLPGRWGKEVTQTMYTYVSKCKK